MRWPHRREDPFAGVVEELGEPAADVTEWLAGLAEQTVLEDAEAAVEVLGPVLRGFGAGCAICGEAFSGDEVVRPLVRPDGSRPYAHESHLVGDPPTHCRHGELFASCAHCTRRRAVHPLGPMLRARRAGVCVVCGKAFRRSTMIRRVSAPAGVGYAHGGHT